MSSRPNFIKLAALQRSFCQYPEIELIIVHTGQHYDSTMSDIFFNELALPEPDAYLGISGGSHTYQKANVMLALEPILKKNRPDIVLVVGDVNATAASCLTAKKMGYPVAHIEAGLRSHDRTMPEEINRIITDSISDLLFVTEQSGIDNLLKEGIPEKKIFYVGNVMIDCLLSHLDKAREIRLNSKLNIEPGHFVLLTMHRPSNVDQFNDLRKLLDILNRLRKYMKVVFPLHPRTKNNLLKYGLYDQIQKIKGVIITEPLGYLEFLALMERSFAVVTDSGGVQEETTFLRKPCFTFRSSTERPVTVEIGSNQLISTLNPEDLEQAFLKVFNGLSKDSAIPKYWDGMAGNRITMQLINQSHLV